MADFKIAEYDLVAAQIDEIKSVADFIPDASTKDGYDKSKRVSLDVGKLMTKLEKTRVEKKAHFIQGGKEVDTQAKAIKVKLDEIQSPHKEAYQLVDQIKKNREAERKEKLDSRVSDLRLLPDNMVDSTSDEIQLALNDLNNEECLDFYEFTEQALKARNDSRTALAKLFIKRKKEEEDAAELLELRRKSAIRDGEIIAESLKAQEEIRIKKAADDARAEAEAKAELAERNKEFAEQREKIAKEEAEAARVKAEADVKQAVIDAEAAAERRIQQDKIDEEAETMRREKNKAHAKKINSQAVKCLMKVEGIDKELAIKMVTAIAKKEIDNVSIKY